MGHQLSRDELLNSSISVGRGQPQAPPPSAPASPTAVFSGSKTPLTHTHIPHSTLLWLVKVGLLGLAGSRLFTTSASHEKKKTFRDQNQKPQLLMVVKPPTSHLDKLI